MQLRRAEAGQEWRAGSSRDSTSQVQWRDNVILGGLVALPVVLDEAQP